jgi:hypothetical protein
MRKQACITLTVLSCFLIVGPVWSQETGHNPAAVPSPQDQARTPTPAPAGGAQVSDDGFNYARGAIADGSYSGSSLEAEANPAADPDPQDQTRMSMPPPVGAPYPTIPASEDRSNYLKGSVTVNGGYSNNILESFTSAPISDASYSVWPAIEFDEKTAIWASQLTYSSGFTFYQRTSSRNEMDQNASLNFEWRLSPHITATFFDSFQKSSSPFNQPDLISATPVTGSAQAPTQAAIPPLADQLTDVARAGLAYQISASQMIGASGTFAYLHYPDPAEAPGLYDSSSRAGSVFYNKRLARRHYIGALYMYSNISTYTAGAPQTQTSATLLFYTLYLNSRLSFSLSGGPQYLQTTVAPLPSFESWSPEVTASLGWQGNRAALAGSYARLVTAGGGLVGAFRSNTATATVRWRAAREWTVGSTATYTIYETALPLSLSPSPGGHGASGTVSLRHPVGQHFITEVGYSRLSQSYPGIAAISADPNINRAYISITYQFTRPLGK